MYFYDNFSIVKISTDKCCFKSMFVKCDICNRKFSRYSSMRHHRNTKCKNIKAGRCDYTLNEAILNAVRNCNICGLNIDISEYRHHSLSHRTASNTTSSLSSKFECYLCTKTFTRRNTLKVHIERVHKSLTPFIKCPLCPSTSFKSEKDLYQHTKNTHLHIRGRRGMGSFVQASTALDRAVIQYSRAFAANEVSTIEVLSQMDSVWDEAVEIIHREVSIEG